MATGAGAGGSSAAYYLKKFADGSGVPINITVFEKSDYIGGRSTTVNAWDHPEIPVELGGSIFVQVNKILVSAVTTFNLTTTKFESTSADDGASLLGIWNGKKFIFQQDESSSFWWDVAKLVWRYGLSPIKTNNLMKSTIAKFLQMYEEPVFPWKSLSDVAYKLGLTAVTSSTGEQFLRENGISAAFANEIIQASTRVNYAQNLPLIHGLETMVCMATSGAMAVVGGNWQIFHRMVKYGTSDVRLSTKVSSIKRQDSGLYAVEFSRDGSDTSQDNSGSSKEIFDHVILAGPYQFSEIELSPEPKNVPSKVPYVQLHVTLFASPYKLSPLAFDLPNGTLIPSTILTTLSPDEHPGNSREGVGSAGFFSISTLREEYNPKLGRREYLYKIFSPTEVQPNYLARLLGVQLSSSKGELAEDDVSWILRKLWSSYPYEYPRVTFEELELDSNLWYTGGMDSFISTMETNALMGMNVAKLIVDALAGGGTKYVSNADDRHQLPINPEL